MTETAMNRNPSKPNTQPIHSERASSIRASSAHDADSLRCELSLLRVLELWTVRDGVSETTAVLAPDGPAVRAGVGVLERLDERRDALLALLEQVLEVEQRLGRRIHVDERGRDTRLA